MSISSLAPLGGLPPYSHHVEFALPLLEQPLPTPFDQNLQYRQYTRQQYQQVFSRLDSIPKILGFLQPSYSGASHCFRTMDPTEKRTLYQILRSMKPELADKIVPPQELFPDDHFTFLVEETLRSRTDAKILAIAFELATNRIWRNISPYISQSALANAVRISAPVDPRIAKEIHSEIKDEYKISSLCYLAEGFLETNPLEAERLLNEAETLLPQLPMIDRRQNPYCTEGTLFLLLEKRAKLGDVSSLDLLKFWEINPRLTVEQQEVLYISKAKALAEVASYYAKKGKREEARALFRNAISVLGESQSFFHPQYSQIFLQLIKFDVQEAFKIHQEILSRMGGYNLSPQMHLVAFWLKLPYTPGHVPFTLDHPDSVWFDIPSLDQIMPYFLSHQKLLLLMKVLSHAPSFIQEELANRWVIRPDVQIDPYSRANFEART